MDKTRERLTVYFEEPFWVGIFERISGGMLTVCKVTFGAEPKDYEVQEFILKHYSRLRFSPAVEIKVRSAADHPKRRMRNAKKTAGTFRCWHEVSAGIAAAAGRSKDRTQAVRKETEGSRGAAKV